MGADCSDIVPLLGCCEPEGLQQHLWNVQKKVIVPVKAQRCCLPGQREVAKSYRDLKNLFAGFGNGIFSRLGFNESCF